jgi:hypothetical protein
MNSINISQILTLVIVDFGGLLVSVGLGWLFMEKLLNPDSIAEDARKRGGPDYKKLGHLGTNLQRWVGAIEILLYSSSVVFDHPQFIAVWLGTKYVVLYRTWGKESVGRTFYNRSLFGSGLNILIGAATGGIARLGMHNHWQWTVLWKIVISAVTEGPMLQLVAGGIITILTAVLVEYLRTPSLKLSIEAPPLDVHYDSGRPATAGRYLRLKLSNKALPSSMRWLQRTAALQCHGNITFHHLNDGQNVFGRAMAVRWAASPEPIPIQAITTEGVRIQIFDPMRLTTECRVDVYPGEFELLDVCARFDEDHECYGWNNEAYFSNPLWRNPAWRLDRGRYLVRVEITSSGQKCVGCFRIINDVARNDFRLETATHEDIRHF